jgi:Kef-type K+ transport system membrane component KefB
MPKRVATFYLGSMNPAFFPSLPFALSYPLLFGVLLVAGMLGGEAARAVHLPRILGYVMVGFVIAPLAAALDLDPLVEQARIFVDLALGLVLFDLGRRMHLQWLKRDWTLAATALAENALTFGAVFATLIAFDFRAVNAALCASIAMATSPAVLLLIVQDTRAEGQVTERALNLVALNSLFASILSTILLTSASLEARMDVDQALLLPLYLFAGSLVLGFAMAAFARVIARSVEKTRDLHFTLIAGLVVAAVGLATLLKLSVILALLAFGLFSRNDDRGHELLNVNLAPASRLLYIVLFVITGASLPLTMLAAGGVAAVALVAARALGKFAGVLLFAPFGVLRLRQAFALGCALTPMSTIALMLQFDAARHFPEFGASLSAVFLSAVILMEILGPIATQWGLRLAGDAAPDEPVPTSAAASSMGGNPQETP